MSDLTRSWWRVCITFGSMGVGATAGILAGSYSLSVMVGLFGGMMIGRKFW